LIAMDSTMCNLLHISDLRALFPALIDEM
jgi:hypothetical protein